MDHIRHPVSLFSPVQTALDAAGVQLYAEPPRRRSARPRGACELRFPNGDVIKGVAEGIRDYSVLHLGDAEFSFKRRDLDDAPVRAHQDHPLFERLGLPALSRAADHVQLGSGLHPLVDERLLVGDRWTELLLLTVPMRAALAVEPWQTRHTPLGTVYRREESVVFHGRLYLAPAFRAAAATLLDTAL